MVLHERDRAEHVLRMLQDAIVAADPARVGGGTLTMREVLAQAEVPLERMFDTEPELYADLAACRTFPLRAAKIGAPLQTA